jgi:hypothetical protein
VESTWEVDGEPIASFDEVAKQLAVPYQPTSKDVELLKLVPDDWTLLERRSPFLRLRDVGLVEFQDEKCRRTDAGRAAMKE